jgi:hypothetical protein
METQIIQRVGKNFIIEQTVLKYKDDTERVVVRDISGRRSYQLSLQHPNPILYIPWMPLLSMTCYENAFSYSINWLR